LTVARPQLLVNGSDDEFRRLVHGLFGIIYRLIDSGDKALSLLQLLKRKLA
jgi:hypothetical protein